MSLVTISSVVASIVPFDPTVGVTVVATITLSAFVLAMVGFALAPIVSSSRTERPERNSSDGSSLDADGAD